MEVTIEERQRRRILFATCTALMAVIASASALNVAQQDFAIDLAASQGAVLWIINSYVVVLAALLMPIGAMGDRWGRKPVLVAGMFVFGLASIGAALAPSTTVAIAARVIAGVGAAMIMPVTLSVITSSFPQEHRTRAIGVWSAVAGGGGLIGMLASAILVDLASWRWVFAVPVALTAVGLAVTISSVPNAPGVRTGSFDVLGSLFSALTIGGFVLGVYLGPERGWSAPLTVMALVGALLGAVGFIAWERRAETPLLDLTVFRDRRLATGSVSLVVVFGVLGGVFIVLFPYFQAVIGWSALTSMVALLPMMLVMMASTGLAARPAEAIGTRATLLIGVGVAAVGLGLMAALVSVDGGYVTVLPGMIVIGVGVGLTMTPSTAAITSSLPLERQGVASALNDATREVGTALGVALLGAVLAGRYSDSVGARLEGFSDEGSAAVAADGIGAAFRVAAEMGDDDALELMDAARSAFVDGWSRSMWVGVATMAALFVFVLLRGPRQTPAAASDGRSKSGGDDAGVGTEPHSGAHPGHFDSEHAADRLAVEGELAQTITRSAVADVARMLADASVDARRVMDVGSGPGVATVALARSFPSATVLALDSSKVMLERVSARARAAGLERRVETRVGDLDADLSGHGRCDVLFASMAVHHAADEVAALRRLGGLLTANGLLCVLERAEPNSAQLGDDLGRPGIWDRLADGWLRWFEENRTRLPGALNGDRYPEMLRTADLEPVIDRVAVAEVPVPSDDAGRGFAVELLQRTVDHLSDHAVRADLDALAAALERTWDADAPMTVRVSRRVLIARRATRLES